MKKRNERHFLLVEDDSLNLCSDNFNSMSNYDSGPRNEQSWTVLEKKPWIPKFQCHFDTVTEDWRVPLWELQQRWTKRGTCCEESRNCFFYEWWIFEFFENWKTESSRFFWPIFEKLQSGCFPFFTLRPSSFGHIFCQNLVHHHNHIFESPILIADVSQAE